MPTLFSSVGLDKSFSEGWQRPRRARTKIRAVAPRRFTRRAAATANQTKPNEILPVGNGRDTMSDFATLSRRLRQCGQAETMDPVENDQHAENAQAQGCPKKRSMKN